MQRSSSLISALPHPLLACTLRSLGDIAGDSTVCCSRGAVHSYHHAAPQSYCLLAGAASTQQLAVDWVGRVEAFEEDCAELLRELNARPGLPQLPPMPRLERANAASGACYESGGGSSGGHGGDIQRFSEAALQSLRIRESNGMNSPWLGKLNVSYPCERQTFYDAPYQQCRGAVAAFYADDVRLLHSSTSLLL